VHYQKKKELRLVQSSTGSRTVHVRTNTVGDGRMCVRVRGHVGRRQVAGRLAVVGEAGRPAGTVMVTVAVR
jgi:hypothetical protein